LSFKNKQFFRHFEWKSKSPEGGEGLDFYSDSEYHNIIKQQQQSSNENVPKGNNCQVIFQEWQTFSNIKALKLKRLQYSQILPAKTMDKKFQKLLGDLDQHLENSEWKKLWSRNYMPNQVIL
jgi:hypothetical protein